MGEAPERSRTPKHEPPKKQPTKRSKAFDKMIPVLGMDPSFRNWAYAYAYVDPHDNNEIHVVRVDTLTTTRSKSKQVRRNSDDLRSAQELHQGLHGAIEEWNPLTVISEIPSGSQSATASRGLGIAVGVLGSMNQTLIQVMPQEVKLAFIGSKTASKRDIIERATTLYPDAGWKKHGGRVTNDQEHAADAIAALYAGVQNEQFAQMLNLWQAMRRGDS